MWNSFHLECPVQDVCEYKSKNSSKINLFHDLVSILSAGADMLTSDHPIWTEINVFNNIQSKYKRILHCDKLLYLIQRVGRCLVKMVLLNLSKSYLDLSDRFIVSLRDPNTTVLLPSRQQLEYILIRTQAASKLICEALEYSRDTFCYLLQKLSVGHLLLDLLMATSVTARLNIMLKALLVQICDLYKKIFPWLAKLKKGDWEWSSSLTLPEDLEEWLKPDHFDSFSSNTTSQDQINALATYFLKKTANSNNEVKTQPVIEIDLEDDVSVVNFDNNKQVNEDYGEVISREKTVTENQHRKLTTCQKIILRKIYKAKTLKKLLAVWDNITLMSEDLYPLNLTEKKINKMNKLLDRVKKNADDEHFSIAQSKKIRITQTVRFRFTKCLGLVKTKEEYSSLAQSLFRQDEKEDNFKPVRKIKELKQLHKEMCKQLSDASESQKLKKLTKYYQGQYSSLKELKKNCDFTLVKKLTYYSSKVLINMFNGQ